MPVGVIASERDEQKWEKAKQIAEKAGKKDNYAYIMGIYKKMNTDHIFNKTAHVSFRSEMSEIVKEANRFQQTWKGTQKAYHGAKDYLTRNAGKLTEEGIQLSSAMSQGSPAGALLAYGGAKAAQAAGSVLKKSTNPILQRAGNIATKNSNVVGDVIGGVMDTGGITKRPTKAVLSLDGDPEAVIPLGNDPADIKNRKKVLKEAKKIMKQEKEKKASVESAMKEISPGVGAVSGAYLGYKKPDLFNPKALFPKIKDINSKQGKILSGILGSATLSGVGYLPESVIDAVKEVKKIRGKSDAPNRKKLFKRTGKNQFNNQAPASVRR